MCGSSPHVRGTSASGDTVFVVARFIPARAGNINHRPAVWRNEPVHPRTCGEHMLRKNMPNKRAGSSPHVRGTCAVLWSFFGIKRFIPARAGNMAIRRGKRSSMTVHPRTCGEHCIIRYTVSTAPGSSPRAGNMFSIKTCFPNQTVHPRTCGEHSSKTFLLNATCGSSPHVRGTFSY